MIRNNIRLCVLALCALVSSYARGFDFWEDGIFYNVLSYEDATVEVTHRGGENSYQGSFVDVPATVSHGGYTFHVKGVGEKAFYNCNNLDEVTIPEGVEYVGEKSLSRISNLTKMTLPKSLKNIGNYAFADNSDLKSITLNCESVCIGEYAFYKCTALTSISLKGNVSEIKENAFDHCEALTSFTIPSGVTHIGENAFLGCYALTAFKVSADNTSYCSKNKAIFSKDMETIVAYPNGLEGEYVIPSSVKTIGGGAFGGCKLLTSLVIPSSVDSIGIVAFNGCRSLKSITNLATTPQPVREDMFSTFGKLHVLPGCKSAYRSATGWNKFTIVDDAEDAESSVSAMACNVRVHRQGNTVTVDDAPVGISICVYSLNGILLMSQKVISRSTLITLPTNRVCVIKVGDQTFKLG